MYYNPDSQHYYTYSQDKAALELEMNLLERPNIPLNHHLVISHHRTPHRGAIVRNTEVPMGMLLS